MKAGSRKIRKKRLIFWGMMLSISCIVIAVVWNSLNNQYTSEILNFREKKDKNFKFEKDSPIEDQVGFKQLDYFDPNPKFKVIPTLEIRTDSSWLVIQNNDGERNKYLRYANAIFTIDGVTDTLTIFMKKNKGSSSLYFFVPFIDETNGDETYAGGRYLHFENKLVAGFTLDFNLAYNPYCVYNYRYSCPIPPKENALSMSIEAGERSYNK